MKNSITTIEPAEIECVNGAGEAGRKIGEDIAKAFDADADTQKLAGDFGSWVEDKAKELFS